MSTCDFLQLSREEQLQQKLLEEQFALLQGTVAEAELIIQDAVAKLDDPLHIRCTSSPGTADSYTGTHAQSKHDRETVCLV